MLRHVLRVALASAALSACADDERSIDAGVESRLCARVVQCARMVEQDAGARAACEDTLGACTEGLDDDAREQWEQAIGACLAQEPCRDFARCYLDAPASCDHGDAPAL